MSLQGGASRAVGMNARIVTSADWMVGKAEYARRRVLAAPATATALAGLGILLVILGLGAVRATLTYRNVISAMDSNSLSVARHTGIWDAANILSELADGKGAWSIPTAGGRLGVARGEKVLFPLQARLATLADGSVKALVEYVLMEREGESVVAGQILGVTRSICMLVAMRGSAYASARLEIGISSGESRETTWFSPAKQRPSISLACSALPELTKNSTVKDAIYMRAIRSPAPVPYQPFAR